MKRMKTKQLALELCRREGKKSQVNIAQMTEVVGNLAELTAGMSLEQLVNLAVELQKLGKKRLAKKL